MTEGSETWELDSKGKVVDICGTREVLYFNFGHVYNKKLKLIVICMGLKEIFFRQISPMKIINLILGILEI